MSLRVENLEYKYNAGTALESYALKGVNLEINKGEFVGIIGRTGSGKSTLIQHFNGLYKPSGGAVFFDEKNINEKGYNYKELRQKVGLVFQYPEYQLFEETVLGDVAYGPRNMGLSSEEAVQRAVEALTLVGIKEHQFNKSPFELSGGNKRRVAIAGVIAMRPDYLILDEPTAGLDPQGRDNIFLLIKEMREKTGMAIIMVSHSMEDVAKYVDRLVVLDGGKIAYDDVPKEVFKNVGELEKMGLSAPQMVYVANALRSEGYEIDKDAITVDEVYSCLEKLL